MSIARVLNQHPLCQCSHEHPANRSLIRLTADYCHEELDADEMRFYLEGMFPASSALRLRGESHQRFSYLIPLLADLASVPRFVWLLRDGRSVVASIHARGWYGAERPILVWPETRIQGDRCGDLDPGSWKNMSPFERCCWYWAYTNRRIETDLDELGPERAFQVRLEELGDRRIALLAFLNLPLWRMRMIHANRNEVAPKRHERWEAWQHEAFDHWCGKEMDRWYPNWRGAQ